MTRHGTISTYCNNGCRCDDCREAQRQYMRRYRSTEIGRRKARLSTRMQTQIAIECRDYLREHDRDAYYQIVDRVRSRMADA